MKSKCCNATVHKQNGFMFCSHCIKLLSVDDVYTPQSVYKVLLALFLIVGSIAHAYAPTKFIHSVLIPKMVSDEVYAIDHLQVGFIESGHNSKAVSVKGAFGNMQIMPVTLDDWNKMHPKEVYSPSEARIESVNIKIGKWMLEERIPSILTSKDIPLTINNILISYNWGAGNLVRWYNNGCKYKDLPEETQQYICKYWAKF